MSKEKSDADIDRSEEPMALLVEELTRRLLAGEVVDIESFACHYPEGIARLKELMPVIETMVVAGRSGLSRDGLLKADMMGVESRMIGGEFRIVRVIGRGGMGVVYEAEQLNLSRSVALKVLPMSKASDSKSRARFQIEVNAASKLKHRNIVQVHSVGVENGLHYYAMQFIDGPSLSVIIRWLRKEHEGESPEVSVQASRIAQKLIGLFDSEADGLSDEGLTLGRFRSGSISNSEIPPGKSRWRQNMAKPKRDLGIPYFRSIAYLGLQAAEALHHAHDLGVVHRDIKPSNLLIDNHGTIWITDFGLAQIQGHGDLTGSDELIGTTRYMSPEQAEAKHFILDDRTDIYSLGVTLYELVTLEAAFPGANLSDVIRRIIHEDPIRPSNHAPKLPLDFETIILKAISKNPGDRYENAKELAEDLRRFLSGQPVKARRVSRLERAYRACRRHPLVASLCTTIVLLASLWGSYVYMSLIQLREAHAAANHQRAIQMNSWAGSRAAMNDPAVVHLQALALRYLTESDAAMNRRIRHEFAMNLLRIRPISAVMQMQASANAAAMSPDGKWIACGGDDGKLHLRRIGEKDVKVESRRHQGPIRSLAFSPDGHYLGTSGDDGKVLLTPIGLPEERPVILLHEAAVVSLAYDRKSERILTGAADKTARVWNVRDGTLVREIRGHDDTVTAVSFVGDSSIRILTGTGEADARGRLWDLNDTSAPIFVWEHSDRINTVGVSPDGTVAVTGSSDLTACLWSLKDGRLLHPALNHEAPVLTTAFSTDGLLLWTGGWDAEVTAWNVLDGTIQQPKAYASDRVVGLNGSFDGRSLMACGMDGRVLVWDLTDSGEVGKNVELATGRTVVSDDRKWLLNHYRKRVTLWALDPLRQVGPVFEQDSEVRCAAFRSGSSKFLFALDDGTLKQIDTGAVEGRIGKYPAPVNVIAAHRNGHYLLGFDDGTFRLFDQESSSIGPAIELRGSSTAAAFSPSGDTFALGTRSGHFEIWTTGIDIVYDYRFGSSISAFAFDTNASRLLIGGDNGYVRLFDVPEHMTIGPRLKVGGPVGYLGFAPDERTFSSISITGDLNVIDMELNPVGPTLKPPTPSNGAILQSDGETIVRVTRSGRVLIGMIPRPTTSPPEELSEDAILRTAVNFDENGKISHIDENAWNALRRRIQFR